MTNGGVPRVLIPLSTTADLEYNRACWPQYARAVQEAGGEAVQVHPEAGRSALVRAAGQCEAILLPGSPADLAPERYGHAREEACGRSDEAREACDWTLLEYGDAHAVPLLGVCFGTQSLNVYRGGTLVQDLACRPVNHAAGASVGVAHVAVIEATSTLAGWLSEQEAPTSEGVRRLAINSSHHQAIGVPGEGLHVMGRSAEDGVVEAIEGPPNGRFLLGVQWHPERTTGQSEASRAIFRELVRAAAAWRVQRNRTGSR